jgi:quercetin dioxygenase-like cupin family protein
VSLPTNQEQPQPAGSGTDMVVFDLRALSAYGDDGPAVTVLSDIGTARVVLFTFRAGQQLKEHQTSSQILVHVLRGRVYFTSAGQTVDLRAGMLVQLEARARHSLVAQTNAVVLVTMAPSPSYHSLEREVFAKHAPLVSRVADQQPSAE